MWEAPFWQTAVDLRAYEFAFEQKAKPASAKIKYVSSRQD